jgi:2-succinyl-6-hydroxy-2,4-cyclohexadiene-1-carboxylate synthase
MILALHGNVGAADDWRPLEEQLRLPLTKIDLWQLVRRGEGLTAAAEKIARQCEPGAILLGYSLGGRLALHALLEHPEVFRCGILLSTHTGLENVGDRLARRAADARWAEMVRTQPWSVFAAAWNAQPVFGPDAGRVVDSLAGSADAMATAFEEWSLGRQENLLERCRHLAVPTLWLAGERDEKFAALASSAAQCAPGAVCRIIPGAGHRIHLENPADCAAAIRTFLTNQPPA